MGLNREVRDFFTSRINRVLDEKIKEVRKPVDTKLVEKKAIELFTKKYSPVILAGRWEELDEKEKKIREEKKQLSEDIRHALIKSGESLSSYRTDYLMSDVSYRAKCLFEKDIMAEMYPGVLEEVARIEAIKEDVQGTVLISTTEPKLVEALNKLLMNYGGDISELLKLIPKS
jgi:hypothetical protein